MFSKHLIDALINFIILLLYWLYHIHYYFNTCNLLLANIKLHTKLSLYYHSAKSNNADIRRLIVRMLITRIPVVFMRWTFWRISRTRKCTSRRWNFARRATKWRREREERRGEREGRRKGGREGNVAVPRLERYIKTISGADVCETLVTVPTPLIMFRQVVKRKKMKKLWSEVHKRGNEGKRRARRQWFLWWSCEWNAVVEVIRFVAIHKASNFIETRTKPH